MNYTNKIITELPKRNTRINWGKTVGMNINILYRNIEYSVEIIKYINNKMPKLIIKYLDTEKTMAIGDFGNCKFANLLNLFEYKYEIGEILTNNNGNIKIINKIKIPQMCRGKFSDVKAYEYECLICDNTDIIREGDLNQHKGCNVCSNNKTLKDVNSVSKTHPYIVTLFKNKEDGDIYSHGSRAKVLVKCPDCGYEHEYTIQNLVSRGFNCKKCGDKVSFPNKFIFNMLQQTSIEFETEYSPKWVGLGSRRYDFFIPSLNCIIEANGLQHYEESKRKGSRTLKEENENDNLKEKLATENGIGNYIKIDCRKSELEFIKNNLFKSELIKLLNIDNINWNKCAENSYRSLLKKSCDIWNSGIDSTVTIGKMLKMNRCTISKYLKRGTLLGFCNYNVKEEMKKSAIKNGKKKIRAIICLENGNMFTSITECTRQMNISTSNISSVCVGRRKKAGGFTFQYLNNYVLKNTI